MGTPIQLQDLVNASIDTTNLGKVVNGAATDPDVALRTGGTAMTLRKAAATIAKGDPGPVGEVSGTKLAAFNGAQMAPTYNIFDATKIQSGYYINKNTGAVAALAGYFATAMMPANAGGTMTCNQWQNGASPSGVAFYDVSGAFISGISGPIAPNTPFSVPSTAVYVALTLKAADYTAATMMIVWGSVIPGAYASFAKAAASDVATLAASTATSLATNAAAIATNVSAVNLLDPSTVALSSYIESTTGVLSVAGGAYTGYAASGYTAVLPGMKFAMNKPIVSLNTTGLAFYKKQVYVSGISGPIAAGTVITAPAGVDSFRVTMQGADQYTQTVITTAGCGASITTAAVAAIPPPAALPFAGKNLAVFGDSYTASYGSKWLPQLAALTGFTVALNKSLSGRSTQNIFDDYPTGGSTTLAQLTTALAGIDCVLIPLGTNDNKNSGTIGAQGDAASAATQYGYIRNAIELIQTAKPSIKIIWVGQLYYSAAAYSGGGGATPTQAAALIAAFKYVCNSYGVPYLDLYSISGVNNLNWSYFLRDGVHPTDAAFGGMFAPLIARAMSQYITIV